MKCNRCYSSIIKKTSDDNLGYCNLCMIIIARELLNIDLENNTGTLQERTRINDNIWRFSTIQTLRELTTILPNQGKGYISNLAWKRATSLGLIKQ